MIMKYMPNLDLAIAARTRVHQGVVRADKTLDSDKRWFWELLQNAKDTVARNHGQVDVKITFKVTEGIPILRFEHNGGVFNYSNHPYKYDDPKCLLLADTGKIEEDESQREDITGQFGTGFLSTHILSLKVLVEGVFFNRDERFYNFKFELDRKYNNPLELTPKIQNSLDQYDDSLILTTQPPKNTFHTKFTYFLDENSEANASKGHEIVRNGIKGIYNFIPYVMAFCREVNSIEIIDEIDAKQSVRFSRTSELLKIDNQVQVVSINRKSCDIFSGVTTENSIEIALCSDSGTHVDVAIEIQKNGLISKILPIDPELPVLFCTFPLIGSEKWRFPLMVNCTKFYPKTERDGIFLLTGNDNGNQSLIEKAVGCYNHLLNFAIKEKFQNLYWLAQTSFNACPTEWTSEEWYKGILSTIRKTLLDKEMVVKESGEFILLKEALFPFHTGREKLEQFWEICSEFIGSFIPKKQDIEIWNKIINADYSTWQVDIKYDIERLLKEIQNIESLNQLAKNKFNENENAAIDWLKKVINFVVFQIAKPELLKTYKIVPNQQNGGVFCSIDENIHFDNGIPDKFKNILEHFAGWSFRKILIHEKINGFENHSPKTTKNISVKINELIAILIEKNLLNDEKDSNIICRGVFFQLISFFTDNSFSERKHLYDFSCDLLPDNEVFGITIVANLSDFDFSACNGWVIKTLIEKVSKVNNLEGLQNINTKFQNKSKVEIISWLDDFIVFVAEFEKKKHKDLLQNFSIIPNQDGDFCQIDLLKKYNGILCDRIDDDSVLFCKNDDKESHCICDLFQISRSSYIHHEWKKDLLHKKLNHTKLLFDEKGTITIEDIALEINSSIRDHEGDKQDKKFAELIFLMNGSKTVNSSKYKKLFSDFHSKKDSLIVGTLGEGETLTNVAKLIQNPDKLAILAEFADNKNISNAQLVELNNILTSETTSIADILGFANNVNNQSNRTVILFDGVDPHLDEKETNWRQIALMLFQILKNDFIEPLREAGLNYDEFRFLVEKFKNNEVLFKSTSFNTSEVPETFDKVEYKERITALAILKVLSHLTETLGYEIIEVDDTLSTIFKVGRDENEFMIVIRPSNGQRYQLHNKERQILSNKDAELWLSNGVYVTQETFIHLAGRIFNTGTAFIPLDGCNAILRLVESRN